MQTEGKCHVAVIVTINDKGMDGVLSLIHI